MGIDDEGHPCGFCFVMYEILYKVTKLMRRLDLRWNICQKVDWMKESFELIGIQDIKKVEKEEEAVEDSKEEMILGPKKMWKDLEKEMAIRVNRNKEILGEIEGDIEMEDIEVKEEIEEIEEVIEETEETVEIEEIVEIDGKIVGVMIDGKEEVTVAIGVKEEIDTIEEIVKIVIKDAETLISRIVKKNNIRNAHNESNALRRKQFQLKFSPVIIEQL